MSHNVIDRRGGQNEPPAEACRVCGSPTVHTREYNMPSMECIAYLRECNRKNAEATFERIGPLEERISAMENHLEKLMQENVPLRFRFPTPKGVHPNGKDATWCYGVYFPATDLVVTDMGKRGTGQPTFIDLEWIDNDRT